MSCLYTSRLIFLLSILLIRLPSIMVYVVPLPLPVVVVVVVVILIVILSRGYIAWIFDKFLGDDAMKFK